MATPGFALQPEDAQDRDYGYDSAAGIYEFEVNGRTWTVDEATLGEIQHRYSYEGDNWTQQEIARVYDVPKKVLEIILRKAGVFKASAAWTRERLEAVEDPQEFDDLASATYEARAHSYQAKQMRYQLREMRKELDTYRSAEYEREQLQKMAHASTMKLAEAGFKSWKVDKTVSATRTKGEKWVCHAPLADLHAGLFVWGKEQWGGDYDLPAAKDTIINHAKDVADWIHRQPGRCDTLYFTDIGDFYHGIGGSTEHGTPMHQDTRSKKILNDCTEAKFEAVEIVRKVARNVILMGSNGNHDHLFHYDLFRSLKYYFRAADDVQVFDALRPETHFVVGDVAHVLLHGTKLGKLSAPNTKVKIDVMIHEVVDDPRVRSFVTYVGHLHEVEVATHGRKNLMKRLPAAAPTDEYGQSLYFSHVPAAECFRLDARGRIMDAHNTFFDYGGEQR